MTAPSVASFKERVRVVLVRPLRCGNIGSAARAMKNMGLSRLVLVSPQHEWHGQQQGSLDEPETCEWVRPDWNRLGMERWLADPPEDLPAEVIFIGDMQDEFKPHHPCCEVLQDVECEDESWFVPEHGEPAVGAGDGWTHFGCDGAVALADFWFAALKAVLLNGEFECD